MDDRKLRLRYIVGRFIIGAPLNGKRRTNATFLKRGETTIRAGGDRPGMWSYLPGVAKAGIRLFATLFVVFLLWAWFSGLRWIDYTVAALIIVGFAASIALYIYERRQETADQRMPWSVRFKGEYKEAIEKNDGALRPIVGFTYGKRPVVMDFDADSPHCVASMGTGAGKSTLMRGIIAQLIHDGVEHVTLIDPKLISLVEFAEHPRVTICVTYPEMWAGLTSEYDIMQERYGLLQRNPRAVFPRRVVIIEEGNSFAAEIRMYWNNELGGKGPAPIIGIIALMLFKGRQANLNLIGAYQRLSVATVGSGDARDQFGYKIMARFSPAAWKSLVAITPIPRAPRHRGRALVVIGEDIIPVQMVAWSPVEALAYANREGEDDADVIDLEALAGHSAGHSAGHDLDSAHVVDQGKRGDSDSRSSLTPYASVQVNPMQSNTSSMQDQVSTGHDLVYVGHDLDAGHDLESQGHDLETHRGDTEMTGPDTQTSNTTPPPGLPDDYGVTLMEAVELKLVTCTYSALRSARQRGQFPEPLAETRGRELLFSVRAIKEWEAVRVTVS